MKIRLLYTLLVTALIAIAAVALVPLAVMYWIGSMLCGRPAW